MTGREISEAMRTRFWAKVDKTGSCWTWTASLNSDGYGHFGSRDSQWRAHRFAWTDAHGPIPPGLVVCHACDNPICVRPDHLFLGTPAANNADMIAKGRARPAGPHEPARGERAGAARLTDAAAAEVRALWAGGARQVDLAQRFGVGQSTISRVVRGALWTHVGGPLASDRGDVCRRGHPFTPENTIHVDGHRRCRECKNRAWRDMKARQRAHEPAPNR